MSSTKTKRHESSRHSHKANKKSESKHSSTKSSSKRISNRTSNQGENVEFYFAVSELDPFDETRHAPIFDDAGNKVPFDRPAYYGNQRPGRVFHFQNGQVNRADGFRLRPHHNDGHLQITSAHGSLSEYKTYTMFDCGPFVPLIINHTDSTVEDSFFQPLTFNHQPGRYPTHLVTRVASGTGQYQVVAGASPDWLNPLFNQDYANLQATHLSEGLGGDIAIIIGIMALSRPRPDNNNNHGTNFANLWRNNRWHGHHRFQIPYGDLRGVVVHVAVDTEDAKGQLELFENFNYFLLG